MHYSHLISKNKAKFVLLKSKKPKRVFSYCKYFLLTLFFCIEKSKKNSLEFSLSSSATTLEARILATCSKWPEFCHLAQIFLFWWTCLQLMTGNNAKFGKFFQDPKFFRSFMGGVLESQKYSLTQSIQLMNIAEWMFITILEDMDVLKLKSGTCTKEFSCIK